MRLTLRTLLAYLDDTLDPAETKQIGQKVSESPQAQELIARIKEVVRRRRLTTPPASGPLAKVDPNTIAEYIDNILTPEQLAEVEEACLESDVYLAEVAACHQILTVMMSEPALVPPTAKRRMYGLVKGREAIPYRRAKPAGVAADGDETEGHHEEDETLLLGLPLLLRKGGWLRRLAPFLGVLLLAGGLGVAIWMAIPNDQPRTKPARNQVARNDNADQKRAAANSADANGKPEPADKKDQSAAVKPEPKPEPNKQAPKPESKPDAKTEAAKTEVKPETKTETPAVPAGPVQAPPPSTVRREAGKPVANAHGTTSVLLQRRSEREPWQKVAADSPVFTSDRLLSLPGMRNEIVLPSGVQLSLWGNLPEGARVFTLESEAILHDASDVDLDLTLLRGRLVFANRKAQGEAKVRVRFQKEIWNLALLEPRTEVAVELWGLFPPGVPFSKDGTGEGPMTGAGLFVLHGEATLGVRYDNYLMREPPGRNMYYWDNTGPAAREPFAVSGDRLPGWARKDQQSLPQEAWDIRAAQRSALDDLTKRLGDGSVADALSELVRQKGATKGLSRQLGVFCLGAASDLPHLLDALGDDSFREVRVAAVNALRHWIALAPDNDMILYRALEAKFRSGPAEVIMTLLHGYTQQDLANPATYEALIEYLRDEKLPIREMAHGQLAALVPGSEKKIPYDPAGPEKQRESAYRAWKKLIPDGQLPPAPKANGAPPANP